MKVKHIGRRKCNWQLNTPMNLITRNHCWLTLASAVLLDTWQQYCSECDHCWDMQVRFILLLGLSGCQLLTLFLKMMCSTSRSIHVQLRWTHVAIKYIVYKRTLPDASFFFLLFITGCILCNFNFLIFEMWDWEEYLNKTEGEYLMQCVSDDRNQYLKNRIRHFLPYACDISVAIKCWQKTKPLKLKINTK